MEPFTKYYESLNVFIILKIYAKNVFRILNYRMNKIIKFTFIFSIFFIFDKTILYFIFSTIQLIFYI